MKSTTRIYLGDVTVNPASERTVEVTYLPRTPIVAYADDRKTALLVLASELRSIASSAERLAANS